MAHRHIIGQHGMGQDTLLKLWLLDSIKKGHAVLYIDLYGHTTDSFLHYIPIKRRGETIVFDPTRYAIPWNPLTAKNIPLTASVFAEAIKIAWGYANSSTPRMDAMIYNSLVALMETNQSLFGLYLLLANDNYRSDVVSKITDPVVKQFWIAFDAMPKKQQLEQSESTLNKVQVLMADPRIRALCGTRNALDIPALVDDGILFLRLPQGELGSQKSAVIGSILLTQIHQATMTRDTSLPLDIYISGVHTLAHASLVEMLSSSGDQGVTLTIAHQYVDQLDRELWSSIRANCESYVFRTSFDDSPHFPELGDQQIQPYEQDIGMYWHFGRNRPTHHTVPDWPHTPLSASARTIDQHHKRNLHAPATKEINALIAKYS